MKIFKEIPSQKPKTPLLDKVNDPSDIRSFSINELRILSDELREYLLYSVGQSGGHLGGGLGVVELTVVLHYLLNTPFDNLVWDCLLYTSPSPRDRTRSRMPSSA